MSTDHFQPNELNFSGGPGVLPSPVLTQAARAIEALPDLGISVLGVSHRSEWTQQLFRQAEADILELVKAPTGYRVLFLQGGSSLQFHMLAKLFFTLRPGVADYLETGYWSTKSIAEGIKVGPIRTLWSGRNLQFKKIPTQQELSLSQDSSFFHYISNETVEGLQFNYTPNCGTVPLVCDMSSDFLSKPISIEKYDMIYAHAQKNLGPAGVTMVLLKESLLEKEPPDLPAMLSYKVQAKENSIYNTPPVFPVYVLSLVLKWLKNDIGGLDKMHFINQDKSSLIYSLIDEMPDLFQPHVQERAHRSNMNVTFKLPNEKLTEEFINFCANKHISGLQGHRTLGGIRISLYNGMTKPAVSMLATTMRDFAKKVKLS